MFGVKFDTLTTGGLFTAASIFYPRRFRLPQPVYSIVGNLPSDSSGLAGVHAVLPQNGLAPLIPLTTWQN